MGGSLAVVGGGEGKPLILDVGPNEGEAARCDMSELLIFPTTQIIDQAGD